jgi:hypothetical protein
MERADELIRARGQLGDVERIGPGLEVGTRIAAPTAATAMHRSRRRNTEGRDPGTFDVIGFLLCRSARGLGWEGQPESAAAAAAVERMERIHDGF